MDFGTSSPPDGFYYVVLIKNILQVLHHGCNLRLLLQVVEIYNFTQDDLMTEDIFILDCHSDIFVWVGQQVDSKSKTHALTIGEVCFC